jgi:hypothetical protein
MSDSAGLGIKLTIYISAPLFWLEKLNFSLKKLSSAKRIL